MRAPIDVLKLLSGDILFYSLFLSLAYWDLNINDIQVSCVDPFLFFSRHRQTNNLLSFSLSLSFNVLFLITTYYQKLMSIYTPIIISYLFSINSFSFHHLSSSSSFFFLHEIKIPRVLNCPPCYEIKKKKRMIKNGATKYEFNSILRFLFLELFFEVSSFIL